MTTPLKVVLHTIARGRPEAALRAFEAHSEEAQVVAAMAKRVMRDVVELERKYLELLRRVQ